MGSGPGAHRSQLPNNLEDSALKALTRHACMSISHRDCCSTTATLASAAHSCPPRTRAPAPTQARQRHRTPTARPRKLATARHPTAASPATARATRPASRAALCLRTRQVSTQPHISSKAKAPTPHRATPGTQVSLAPRLTVGLPARAE